MLVIAPLLVCAADPVAGTWFLNLAKSRYSPGPPPRSQTRTYTEEKDGIKAVVITVYKNGNTDTVYYPANYDGKEHPVLGAPDRDGIVMKRIDEYTAESILTHAGKTIGVARRTVSPDGRTMTITYKGDSGGESVNNTAVYERKPE
jgi:hypothetical protein